jgi:predicted HicB family RNase H-like nuclease
MTEKKSRGRPKKDNAGQLNIRIEDERKEHWTNYAESKNMSLSEFIRETIDTATKFKK